MLSPHLLLQRDLNSNKMKPKTKQQLEKALAKLEKKIAKVDLQIKTMECEERL
jgi:hypothetical protein